MASKQKFLAVLGLLSGAVTWGLIWYPFRILEQAGVSGELSSFLTFLFALVAGGLIFSGSWRRLRRAPTILVWIGLSAGWANLAYVLAVIHGEVMRVLLLFYLAPFWTVIFARVLLAERLNGAGWLVMGLSLSGAVVMLWHPDFGAPVPKNQAEWLGLSAGFMFALTNVLSRRAQEIEIGMKSLAVWGGVTLLSLFPVLFNSSGLDALPKLGPESWIWLVFVGAVLVLVTLAVQYGLTHTPANQAIVIFLFELVVAAVSSFFLADEALSLREWAGGVMIIAASLFSGKLADSPQPLPK
ncbi:MAG: DMT family transporter [Pseudomonadota bacterium]|jgi:drug/metabolite transporter (DMT)-like permease